MQNKDIQLKKFDQRVNKKIKKYNNKITKKLSKLWIIEALKHDYNYYYKWMGIPIIQYPNDIIAIQEIIFKVKPDVIIETGVAHGGSLLFYSSMLELLNLHKGVKKNRKVIGIEIDFRSHNKKRLQKSKLNKNIKIINSSSTNVKMINQLKKSYKNKKKLIILDSNHTHEHVLNELKLYSNLVNKNSYLIVLDTGVEDLPNKYFKKKKWSVGNNPKTAVKEFLRINKKFKIDPIHQKLQITCAPDGFLKKISN